MEYVRYVVCNNIISYQIMEHYAWMSEALSCMYMYCKASTTLSLDTCMCAPVSVQFRWLFNGNVLSPHGHCPKLTFHISRFLNC